MPSPHESEHVHVHTTRANVVSCLPGSAHVRGMRMVRSRPVMRPRELSLCVRPRIILIILGATAEKRILVASALCMHSLMFKCCVVQSLETQNVLVHKHTHSRYSYKLDPAPKGT